MNIFYSEFTLEDSSARFFNEVEDFLQHFQQCRNQYSKSNMLEWLLACLEKFALEWFNDQSKFTFLYEFDIVLTNAFFFKQINSSSFSVSASEFTCEIFENLAVSTLIASTASQKQQTSKRCQWCQSDYENYYSHRLQYSSCNVLNQQAYESVLQFLEEKICETFESLAVFAVIISSVSSASSVSFAQQKSNALKIAKKTKFNAIKNVKRIKSKTLKIKQVARSTSTVQDVDIFDSIFTCEHRRFNDFAKFLQHFQHCQHLYRKSDLLVLLFTCLWNFAFDIWFDRQTIMNSTSLSEWIDILRVDFANVSFAKIKTANMICMRCDSNFNFKKKLREHVREQHAKKSLNRSSFSVDTVKSVCEIKKKSFIILVESLIFVIFRNHISDTKTSLISSRCSNLQLHALNFASKSMKSASNQEFTCARVICKLCKQNFNFNKKLHEHIRDHEALKIVKDSHFSINAINLVRETMKMSIIACSFVSQKLDISIATSRQKFEFVMIFEIVIASENSHFSFIAFETVSESTENTSIQCSFISSRSSFSQTVESESQEIFVWKFSEFDSFFSIDIVKSVCESKKNSIVTCSSVSFVSQISSIFFSVFKKRCYRCRINILSVQEHYFEFHSFDETLRHRLEQQFARRAHQQEQEIQKQAEVEKVISRSISSICLNFSIATFEIKSKSTKKSATCRRCNKIFNFNNKFHKHIREHYARKFVKSLNFRVFTSEFTYKIIEKSTSIRLSVSFISQKSSILFATSRSQKFWLSTIFESVIASTRSNFSIASYKINSKSMKSAIVNCSLFSSSTSSYTSVRKYQEFHIQKSYLIMNDLHRMFAEKSASFDLQQHQNRCRFSQKFDFRQLDRSRSTSSKKSYLTIENLSEMFDEKFRRKSLFQDQNSVSFQRFFSEQSQMTVYFKFTVSQKSSIIQNSKNSKSKSLNQHMFAKSIRTVFSNNLSEKSIKLSYKMLDVFCVDSKIFFFIFILLRLLSTFLLAFAFVSAMFVARMNCINVYQQVISIIDRVNIELVASRRSWEETKNRMLEYSVTKHLHERCFAYTFYWMNRTHRLSHAFKYRCVNRCYTNSVNTVKLLVSWYNRFRIFQEFSRTLTCLLTNDRRNYSWKIVWIDHLSEDSLHSRSVECNVHINFRICVSINAISAVAKILSTWRNCSSHRIIGLVSTQSE